VNASPDRITDVGQVNLTVGDFLQGNVSIAGFTGDQSGQFSVKACSTDEPTLCGLPVLSSNRSPLPVGCVATNTRSAFRRLRDRS